MVETTEKTVVQVSFTEDRDYSRPVFWTADGKMVVTRFDAVTNGTTIKRLQSSICKIDTRRCKNNAGVLVPRRNTSYIVEEVEHPYVVGDSIVVPTQPEDKIFYARRPRKNRVSRFVVGKLPIPSNYYTVILLENTPTEYQLVKHWVGQKGEIEPCDYSRLYGLPLSKLARKHIRMRSKLYWENHAFVLEHTLYWTATLTDKRPVNWFDAPRLFGWPSHHNR